MVLLVGCIKSNPAVNILVNKTSPIHLTTRTRSLFLTVVNDLSETATAHRWQYLRRCEKAEVVEQFAEHAFAHVGQTFKGFPYKQNHVQGRRGGGVGQKFHQLWDNYGRSFWETHSACVQRSNQELYSGA